MKIFGKTNMLWEGILVVGRNIVCLALWAYGYFLVVDTLLFCR